MDKINHTTEHGKGQHLLSEERHEIEVRLKDGWTVCRIAKHLGRPYNTIKNEISRITVTLYNGKAETVQSRRRRTGLQRESRKMPPEQPLSVSCTFSHVCCIQV